MVVRRNQRHAALVSQTATNGFAVLAEAVVDDDGRAVALRSRHLGSGRVVRHDDHRRHAEQARRERDRLRVVARGERNDAGAALVLVETRQRVERAAELERTHTLEVLTLEEQLCAELGVCRA